MTAWQAQAMWEAETYSEWERLNASDPAEGQMKDAALEIGRGIEFFNAGLDSLVRAVNVLGNTPMQYKVESYLTGIEDLVVELRMIKKNYERGERE